MSEVVAPVFIIGGYSSIKTLKRIVRSYEQMQGPKFVIALGICPVNGGMYFDSYNTINQFDQYIPVDLYITGCMPRPEVLVAGIMELQKKIKEGRCDGANRYIENFDWYKANQKRVAKAMEQIQAAKEWYDGHILRETGARVAGGIRRSEPRRRRHFFASIFEKREKATKNRFGEGKSKNNNTHTIEANKR